MPTWEQMLSDEHGQFDRRSELLKSIIEYQRAEPAAMPGINVHVTDQLPEGVAAIAISPPAGPDDDRPIEARAVVIRDCGQA